MFRQPYVSTTLCFANFVPTYVRQPYVSTTLCFDNPMFRQPYVSTTLCFDNPMFRQPYVSTTLCFDNPMFRQNPTLSTHRDRFVEITRAVGRTGRRNNGTHPIYFRLIRSKTPFIPPPPPPSPHPQEQSYNPLVSHFNIIQEISLVHFLGNVDVTGEETKKINGKELFLQFETMLT